MLLGLYQNSFKHKIIIFAANHRHKGMVIVLCVCVFAKISENYQDWQLKRATGRLHCILISIIPFYRCYKW